MTADVISGRVWIFGDDINTDVMMPGHVRNAAIAEQVRALFAATRPGWSDLVKPGDVLVAGRNFGIGSSRPAARSLKHAGISCVLADSINGLFYRNCVNFGLLALECPGVSGTFQEGEQAAVMLSSFEVRNVATGTVLRAAPIPSLLLELMMSGGIFPLLHSRGLIEAMPS